MSALNQTYNLGYLRSSLFDISFLFLIPIIAISAGMASHIDEKYFYMLLYLDLWLLGYHHVISTYTRLAFDKDGFENQKFLIIYLPILVLISVTAIASFVGIVAIATIYLHWQWYHYTRQSEGISKAYSIKSGTEESRQSKFDRVMFYVFPAACFLYMSSNGPQFFLGMPIWVIPIDHEVATWLLRITLVSFAYWCVLKINLVVKKQISISYFSYLMSHYVIYYIAYTHFENINYGWIVINIWHNAQYIAFVWLFNTNKFGKKTDEKNHLLFLAKPNNALIYFAACVACSSVIYMTIMGITKDFPTYIAMIIYQTVNFHHYIVDSQIWKLRKKPLQDTLKINT